MQRPKHQLSPTERRMLSTIASGNEGFTTLDFVAFHRLKAFGFITVTSDGRATITNDGKQALHPAQN